MTCVSNILQNDLISTKEEEEEENCGFCYCCWNNEMKLIGEEEEQKKIVKVKASNERLTYTYGFFLSTRKYSFKEGRTPMTDLFF